MFEISKHTIRKWRQPGNDNDVIVLWLQKMTFAMAKKYMLPGCKDRLVARINGAVTDEELCQPTMDRISSSDMSIDWRKDRTGCLTKDRNGMSIRRFVKLSTKRLSTESRKSKYILVATHLIL